MIRLCDALAIPRGVTAVVGGGGKTSLIAALAGELSATGRVLRATTTRMWPPPDELLLSPTAEALSRAFARASLVTAGALCPNGKLRAPDAPAGAWMGQDAYAAEDAGVAGCSVAANAAQSAPSAANAAGVAGCSVAANGAGTASLIALSNAVTTADCSSTANAAGFRGPANVAQSAGCSVAANAAGFRSPANTAGFRDAANAADSVGAAISPLLALSALADYTLLEADGARGLPIKAPNENEPVLTGAESLVIAVAGMRALGRPIGQVAHRPALCAALLGKPLDAPITEADMARLLQSRQGQRKGVRSRFAVALNQCDAEADVAAARRVARLLDGPCVLCALQSRPGWLAVARR